MGNTKTDDKRSIMDIKRRTGKFLFPQSITISFKNGIMFFNLQLVIFRKMYVCNIFKKKEDYEKYDEGKIDI